MNTSSFEKSGHLPNAVSIAGRCPENYKGRQYKKLAPKLWFFQKYQHTGDQNFYRAKYKEEVLDKLDPYTVYEELGPDAILLCYERPGLFCHRRIVAQWFKDKLNIDVIEI